MANPENLTTSFLPTVNHNPDVLSCLANLSNDEVFTPPPVANAMLDMLPQDLFRSPGTKFLDPACKSGVFLREITKRLMNGLEEEFPDLQKRLDHILHHQVYGIAITELTSLLSRRTLYCAKYPNCPFSISHFDNISGNIRHKAIQHTWKNGKCVFCGASQAQYERGEGLETHAYEFIHTDNPREIFGDMKFDVIIGNPPYQLSDGGNNASAIPLYQNFVEQAKKLYSKYLLMIIPSRWFAGGRGLDKFRNNMIKDKHIQKIYDFENAEDCFPGVDIASGVCYFLRNKDYNGPCTFINVTRNDEFSSKRYLNEFKILIRSNKAVPIIKKVLSKNEILLDSRVSGQRPFGLRTFARPEKSGDLILRWNGGKGPYPRNKLLSGLEYIDRWKVILSRLSFEHAGKASNEGTRRVLSVLEILQPAEICTETYLVVDSFSTKNEAINLFNYLQTKFVRFLIYHSTSSIMIAKNNFQLVPIQNFTKHWTDAELYKKYNLTQEEIDFIESLIKPMDLSADTDSEAQNA